MNLVKKSSIGAVGLSLLALSIASCGGGGGSSSKISIFAAGTMQQGNETRAVYWKDGEKQELSKSNSDAHSITVKDAKAYVAGETIEGSRQNAIPHATYWLDGTETRLSQDRSNAYAIAVSGADIYVAGQITTNNTSSSILTTKPTYWHNQKNIILNSDGLATSLDLSGGDVYVGGYSTVYDSQGDPTAARVASYWINDSKQEHNISKKEDYDEAQINSLKVKDGTVYACGFGIKNDENYAMYWKGTEQTVLSSNNAQANSIFLYGDDVYVAGSTRDKNIYVATYWKNGKEHKLSENAQASSIFVFEGDVYVGGVTYEAKEVNGKKNTTYFPTYWKNGKKHTFKEINASVTSIFVTKNK